MLLKNKRFFIAVILSVLLYPQVAFGNTDITSNVQSGGSLSSANDETYYVLSGENKYNWLQVPKDISTNYTNGTLIFGNNTKEANSDHTFKFKTWGAYSYTASFTAKDIYLTGNITTSKGSAYTGYFNLYFNGIEGLEAEGFTLNSVANNTAFVSDNGNIDFSSSNITTSSTSTQIIATNGDINFDKSSIINIESGGLTTNASINFKAGGDINLLGQTTITTNYGGASVSFEAGGDLNIANLDLLYVMPLGVSDVYGYFKGKNITLSSGSISQDLSASMGLLELVFEAEGTIDLGTTDISLMAATAATGRSYGSSVTFIGESLVHNGTITLGRDGESVSDQFFDSGLVGALIDISGITGNASLNKIVSRKGTIIANKDLSITTLTIRQSAEGIASTGNTISPQTDFYLQEGGTYNIENLNLLDDNASSQAWLYFRNGTDATLNITNTNLGINSYLDAQSVTTTNITYLYLASGSSALFNNLNITKGGSITMDMNSTITIKSSLDVYIEAASNVLYNYQQPILSVTNFDISTINASFSSYMNTYTYRFIDTTDGITYHYTDINGNTTTTTCDGSGDQTICQYIADSIAIYDGDKVDYTESEDGTIDYTTGRIDICNLGSTTCISDLESQLNAIGLTGEIIANNSYIGISFSRCDDSQCTNNAGNPYDIGDIRYYIWLKGGSTNGDSYVEQIAAISPTTSSDSYGTTSDIFDWLNALTVDYRGITWTGVNIINYDFNFFKQTATQLQNTLEQLASVERKSSSASSTRLATDIAKAQRLVKLSRRDNRDEGIRFADYIKSLSNERYATNTKAQVNVSSNQTSDYQDLSANRAVLDSGFLYKFSNRHSFANSIWANAIGTASFVSGGYGALYGMNAGYDRFIDFENGGVIIGGFGAYGYGAYNADLIANRSHNINTGVYSRIFTGNNEIDITTSYTLGLNTESIDTYNNTWFSPLAQAYNYNTHTFNINASYGYVFGMRGNSLVFKPSVGISYYLINSGAIKGNASVSQFAIESDSVLRNIVILNLSFETRKYYSKGSYWFVNVAGQPSIFVSANDAESVRYISGEASYYSKSDNLNIYLNGTAGGEVQLKEQFFVNFALGGKVGLAIKDTSISGNLGARYVF